MLNYAQSWNFSTLLSQDQGKHWSSMMMGSVLLDQLSKESGTGWMWLKLSLNNMSSMLLKKEIRRNRLRSLIKLLPLLIATLGNSKGWKCIPEGTSIKPWNVSREVDIKNCSKKLKPIKMLMMLPKNWLKFSRKEMLSSKVFIPTNKCITHNLPK